MGELTVETIRDTAQWAGLESAWRALYADSPVAAPPLCWEWCWHWWDLYGAVCGAGPAPLHLLVLRRGGALVGVAPTYLRRVPRGLGLTLSFLSTGEEESEETCADWLDVLWAPGEDAAVVAALVAWLTSPAARYIARVQFDAVAAGTVAARVRDGLRARGWSERTESMGHCWVADQSEGYEAYLASLSRTTRAKCRKLQRQAEAGGAGFALASSREEAVAFFEDLMALHQARWSAAGKPGCFASQRFTELHRRLVATLEPRRELILAEVTDDVGPVAVNYGLRVGDSVQCYQSGTTMDRTEQVLSPGVLAYILMFLELEPEGVKRFDFLLGEGGHKDRLCRRDAELFGLRATRPGLPALGDALCRRLARICRWCRSRRRRASCAPVAASDNGGEQE